MLSRIELVIILPELAYHFGDDFIRFNFEILKISIRNWKQL